MYVGVMMVMKSALSESIGGLSCKCRHGESESM
jgi:hypothetical protein